MLSSGMTLQEELQKVKEAAFKLDREIENSHRYRAGFLKASDEKASTIVDIKVNSPIFDPKNK